MIVLFTDFGTHDPYVGQVKARLASAAPGATVIDLLHEVPAFNAHAGAHLLAAFAPQFPTGSVFLAVVDPGVGSARAALVVEADGRWFVGPDNGLLSIIATRAGHRRMWRIDWRPPQLAPTFHGRDLFAPIAADIARGQVPEEKLTPLDAPAVEFDGGDLLRIVYVDHYGNAWTGIRDATPQTVIRAAGERFVGADVYASVDKGAGFWFTNSVGLVELAVNRGSAAARYGLKIGDAVQLEHLN